MDEIDPKRRKAEARRARSPKSVSQVMAPIGIAQFQNQPTQEAPVEVKYAKSQNLRSRTKVVGTTPFKFDADGICKVEVKPGRGRLLYDFAELLKCPGIKLHGAENQVEEAAAPEPASTPAPLPEPPTPAPAESEPSVETSAAEPEEEPTTDVAPESEPEPEPAEASEKEEEAKPKRRRGRKSRKEKD